MFRAPSGSSLLLDRLTALMYNDIRTSHPISALTDWVVDIQLPLAQFAGGKPFNWGVISDLLS